MTIRAVLFISLSLISLFTNAFAIDNEQADSVVRVYAHSNSGIATQGTGFFITSDGTLLTCYHVIRNATHLTIYFRGAVFTDTIIDAFSPDLDIARVRLPGLQTSTPFLPLAETMSSESSRQVEIIGFPRGIDKLRQPAWLTTSSPTSSLTLRDRAGRRLFSKDIRIIPLDATIYRGVSGSPVLQGNKVIGLLSGSLDEGGTIAWAIPVKYAKGLHEVKMRPESITNWPDLAVMSPSWRSLNQEWLMDSKVSRHVVEFQKERAELQRIVEAGWGSIVDANLDMDEAINILGKTAKAIRESPRSEAARDYLDSPRSVEAAERTIARLTAFGRNLRAQSDEIGRISNRLGTRSAAILSELDSRNHQCKTKLENADRQIDLALKTNSEELSKVVEVMKSGEQLTWPTDESDEAMADSFDALQGFYRRMSVLTKQLIAHDYMVPFLDALTVQGMAFEQCLYFEN